MKRIVNTVWVCALVLCCVLVFCSCGKTKSVNESVPEGYTLFKNEAISFVYPEDYTLTKGDTAMMMAENGNMITVVFEDKNEEYAQMTTESYVADMVPFLEKAGLSVFDVKVEQTKTNGLAATKIFYNLITESGTSMSQTQFIVTAKEKTYTVTVTEVEKEEALAKNVFETLCKVK